MYKEEGCPHRMGDSLSFFSLPNNMVKVLLSADAETSPFAAVGRLFKFYFAVRMVCRDAVKTE